MATWAPPPHVPRNWFPAHRDQDQDGEAEERREHMAIAVGDKVPDVKVWTFGDKGPEATTSAEVLGRGKVVLFGVPGAFTPTCSDHHLPGFVLRADELRAKGADRVVCVSVNDPFVMGAWGEDQKVGDSVVMLSDGNGELAEAMGLTMDGSGFGLGSRIQRFAAVIEDGVVTWLAVEPGPGLTVSSVEEVLEAL
jgi:glutaredoxin/glutathione-dependent peroxiredoxin